MRVDKWIWAVRMVKSRTLAGTLAKQGRVTINGLKAKPASNVKLEDLVEVSQKGVTKTYKVLGFIPKRVSADLAAKNFEDLTPPPETIENTATPENFVTAWGQRTKGEGRPTKKDRRAIDHMKMYND